MEREQGGTGEATPSPSWGRNLRLEQAASAGIQLHGHTQVRERLGKSSSSCLARVGQARKGGFIEGGGESGYRLKLARDISHRQAQGKGGTTPRLPRAEPSPPGALGASPGLQSWEAAGPRDRDGDRAVRRPPEPQQMRSRPGPLEPWEPLASGLP